MIRRKDELRRKREKTKFKKIVRSKSTFELSGELTSLEGFPLL